MWGHFIPFYSQRENIVHITWVFSSFTKAEAGAGMGIHVLPGANYAGFHTNQTPCQVISVISTSSLVESNQSNYLEKRFIYFHIICNHDPMCKAKISRNCHYHHPHIPFHQNSSVPLSAHVARSSWRSSRKGFLSPGGKIISDFMLTFHINANWFTWSWRVVS